MLTPLAIWIGSFAWLPRYLPRIVAVDSFLQRVTGGRVDLLRIAGLPSVTMTVPGRKSGLPRTTTVLAAPDGDDWIIAGSYFGGPKNPQWVGNLRASGAATLAIGDDERRFIASELAGDDRRVGWDLLLSVWPNFALYEQRTDRLIPVFRLSTHP